MARRRSPQAAQPKRLADRLAALDALYAQLPALECRGLCGPQACAQHIDASDAEKDRIAARGVDLDAPTHDGACPALARTFGGDGHCTVHDIRPMICRMWGAAEAMPCPHGCRPVGGPLSDSAMLDGLECGGHGVANRAVEMRAMLNHALDDATLAALLAAYLRGDRRNTGALAAHLTRSTNPGQR